MAENSRRDFLNRLTKAAVGLSTVSILSRSALAGDQIATPQTTTGPFYPVPDIKSQSHIDTDLTRNSSTGEAAEGEAIIVRGSVVDLDGRPLSQAIVEVWQADFNGRYDHPQDNNESPVDTNFQHWARMKTDELGRFAFRTIEAGKYPGRTPHIHFLVDAPNQKKLITQMYFEQFMEANRKDGLYNRMSKAGQKITTVAFEKDSKLGLPVGNFEIVLAKKADARSTPRDS